MVIEIECYHPEKCKKKGLTSLYTVSPGEWTGVNFFGKKIKIAVINSVDGDMGSIFVRGNVRQLKAVVYEDRFDDEGKPVSVYDGLLTIVEKGTLSLETKKRKSNRRADIYLKY
jgi:hypothetical protein